jgi:hypothetical protein
LDFHSFPSTPKPGVLHLKTYLKKMPEKDVPEKDALEK